MPTAPGPLGAVAWCRVRRASQRRFARGDGVYLWPRQSPGGCGQSVRELGSHLSLQPKEAVDERPGLL